MFHSIEVRKTLLWMGAFFNLKLRTLVVQTQQVFNYLIQCFGSAFIAAFSRFFCRVYGSDQQLVRNHSSLPEFVANTSLIDSSS